MFDSKQTFGFDILVSADFSISSIIFEEKLEETAIFPFLPGVLEIYISDGQNPTLYISMQNFRLFPPRVLWLMPGNQKFDPFH